MRSFLDVLQELTAVPVNGAGQIRLPDCGRGELVRVLARMGATTGAEIGVWEGKFSETICAGIPGLHLYAIDPWAPYAAYREVKNDKARLDEAHRQTCQRLAPFQATVMRMTSLQAAKKMPDRSLDFVYIDSNHEASHVDADLRAWAPKVRLGGVLAGHDYFSNPKKPFIQVVPVVDAFTAERSISPWFVLAKDKSPSYAWEVR